MGRIGPQEGHDLLAGAQARHLAFGDVHDDLHLAVARQAQYGLAGGHDLAGLCRHGDDDAVGIGRERRVTLLVGGEGRLRARLVEARLRRGVGGLPGVEGRGADEVARAQVDGALEIRLRERMVGLGRGELRACGLRAEPGILGIESRQGLALSHVRARVHQPHGELAADAKGEIRFHPRAHFPGVGFAGGGGARRHGHREHGPHGVRGLLAVAAGRENGRRGGDEGEAGKTRHREFLLPAFFFPIVPAHSARNACSSSRS